MEHYKNIDLKIDLILLNNETVDAFLDKYKDNLPFLFQKLKILIYLDDFMYIDNLLRDKLILLSNTLTKEKIEYDEQGLHSDIIELNNKSLKGAPRENKAIFSYYRDLNEYISNSNISYDRLKDIYKSIRIINNIYIVKRNNNCNINKVILFLNDIQYNIEYCNIKNTLKNIITEKTPYQKIKK